MPVASVESEWWDHVASEMTKRPGLVGSTLFVEVLTQMTPSYPDGRRPRALTVTRRLHRILHLITRGPNGSRSNGAMYLVKPLPVPHDVNPSISTEELKPDLKWLDERIDQMFGVKKSRKRKAAK